MPHSNVLLVKESHKSSSLSRLEETDFGLLLDRDLCLQGGGVSGGLVGNLITVITSLWRLHSLLARSWFCLVLEPVIYWTSTMCQGRFQPLWKQWTKRQKLPTWTLHLSSSITRTQQNVAKDRACTFSSDGVWISSVSTWSKLLWTWMVFAFYSLPNFLVWMTCVCCQSEWQRPRDVW